MRHELLGRCSDERLLSNIEMARDRVANHIVKAGGCLNVRKWVACRMSAFCALATGTGQSTYGPISTIEQSAPF